MYKFQMAAILVYLSLLNDIIESVRDNYNKKFSIWKKMGAV